MRPESAPKYDVSTVKVNGNSVGVFQQSWTKEPIHSVSDKYGFIEREHWDEAIREHCNFVVSMH